MPLFGQSVGNGVAPNVGIPQPIRSASLDTGASSLSASAPPSPTILEYYSSATQRTTVVADNGNQITVADATMLPQQFPYRLLLAWGAATQEIVFALSSGGGNVLNVVRGQDGTTATAQPPGATVDHGVSAALFNQIVQHVEQSPAGVHGLQPHTHLGAESGGALGIGPGVPMPNVWNILGHSYFRFTTGVTWPTGRMDAMFRRTLDIEFSAWRNYAVGGAQLVRDIRSNGGWARAMQEITRTAPSGQNIHGFPYWADGGGYVICYGINDIGNLQASPTQIRSAYQQALRAVITRCRASVIYEDNYAPASGTVGQPVYGAGFTSTAGTQDFSSGTTLRDATSTTNATITLTLPPDFAGEVVYLQFIANAGVLGGTVTLSGTAGVTGTISTSNIVPAATGTHVPVVQRITGLTPAAAGRTIVCTVTQVDAGGTVRFDCWGLESDYPPPVIVCNCARPTAAGYAGYANVINDGDVLNLNAAMQAVINEFDGMVQIADIDAALGRNPAFVGSDGLHPNEYGSARCSNAFLTAVNSFVPTDSRYPVMSISNSAPVAGGFRRPRTGFQWYTAEAAGTSTLAAAAAGTMYALPYVVTEGREIYAWIGLRLSASATTQATVRWGIYDDQKWSGYPQCLMSEGTSGGAFPTGTTAGLHNQTGLFIVMDPGLWWIVAEIVTPGTGVTFESITGPDRTCIMPTASTGDLSNNVTPIAWLLTGQPTTGLPGTFPTGATITGNAPKIGILTI